jgi:hypothetical protein
MLHIVYMLHLHSVIFKGLEVYQPNYIIICILYNVYLIGRPRFFWLVKSKKVTFITDFSDIYPYFAGDRML